MAERPLAWIDRDILSIAYDKESLWYKAYFDSGHLLHKEAVEKMEALAKEKLGDEPWAPEVMPVTHKFLK